jgi:uncharacterized protein
MLLDLSTIRSPREHYEKTYPSEAFAHEQESFTVVVPITLTFDIFKDKGIVRLIGSVKTTLELPCSRCLEAFQWPLDAQFDLRYQPRVQNVGEDERKIEEDDLSTAFYEDDDIDLGQLMREQCYLSLPMKPLCRAECRGLCPICGANLNRDPCGCVAEWQDPRLAPLKQLRTKN